MPYTQKVDVKSCKKVVPPHPCDPPVPCNPLADPEGACMPYLCFERLKNPETPAYKTRCQPGASIGVKTCINAPPPHPCDPVLCSSIDKTKRGTCNDPPLCKEKIKNPDLKKIRRVMCTDSKGKLVEIEIVKEEV